MPFSETAVTKQPGNTKQLRSIVRLTLNVLVSSIAIAYMAGGITAGLRFALFTGGVLFPAGALLTQNRAAQELSSGFRLVMGGVFAVIFVTPVYYARHCLPFSRTLFDVAIILLLTFTALRTGSYARWLRDLRTPSVKAAAPWVFNVIPLVFASIWTGYAAKQGQTVRFYGLFPIDFGNLTTIVALIKDSRGLPLTSVAGAGLLHYHWFYFTLPAWVSDFAGGVMANSSALELCNYLMACLLFLALCATAAQVIRPGTAPRRAVWVAAMIAFVPLVTYFYQMTIRILGVPHFTMGQRNGLLLSVVNSMVTFGNNTMALAVILLLIAVLKCWNQSQRPVYAIWASLLLVMIVPYSITLVFPVALALAIWFCCGRIRLPLRFVALATVVGTVCLLVLIRSQVFAGSSRRLAFSFDHGQFLQNVFFSMLPLWTLAALAVSRWREHEFNWLLLGSCILVPSFLLVPNFPAPVFSLKTASLMIVASTPVVALGVSRWCNESTLNVGLRWSAGLLVVLGALNTLVYVGQFPFYRLTGSERRSLALPLSYFRTLGYVRRFTPRDAIVLDGTSVQTTDVNLIVMLGERRVYLPSPFDLSAGEDTVRTLNFQDRLVDWTKWDATNLTDPSLSAKLARESDYLITKMGSPPLADWRAVLRQGEFSLYKSQRRASVKE